MVRPLEYGEDRWTRELMRTYGIDRVRGGTFANPDLGGGRDVILREWATLYNTCYNCRGSGHYASACRAASRATPHSSPRSVNGRETSSPAPQSSMQRPGQAMSSRTTPTGASSPAPQSSMQRPGQATSPRTTPTGGNRDHHWLSIPCTRCDRNTHCRRYCYATFSFRGATLQSPKPKKRA